MSYPFLVSFIFRNNYILGLPVGNGDVDASNIDTKIIENEIIIRRDSSDLWNAFRLIIIENTTLDDVWWYRNNENGMNVPTELKNEPQPILFLNTSPAITEHPTDEDPYYELKKEALQKYMQKKRKVDFNRDCFVEYCRTLLQITQNSQDVWLVLDSTFRNENETMGMNGFHYFPANNNSFTTDCMIVTVECNETAASEEMVQMKVKMIETFRSKKLRDAYHSKTIPNLINAISGFNGIDNIKAELTKRKHLHNLSYYLHLSNELAAEELKAYDELEKKIDGLPDNYVDTLDAQTNTEELQPESKDVEELATREALVKETNDRITLTQDANNKILDEQQATLDMPLINATPQITTLPNPSEQILEKAFAKYKKEMNQNAWARIFFDEVEQLIKTKYTQPEPTIVTPTQPTVNPMLKVLEKKSAVLTKRLTLLNGILKGQEKKVKAVKDQIAANEKLKAKDKGKEFRLLLTKEKAKFNIKRKLLKEQERFAKEQNKTIIEEIENTRKEGKEQKKVIEQQNKALETKRNAVLNKLWLLAQKRKTKEKKQQAAQLLARLLNIGDGWDGRQGKDAKDILDQYFNSLAVDDDEGSEGGGGYNNNNNNNRNNNNNITIQPAGDDYVATYQSPQDKFDKVQDLMKKYDNQEWEKRRNNNYTLPYTYEGSLLEYVHAKTRIEELGDQYDHNGDPIERAAGLVQTLYGHEEVRRVRAEIQAISPADAEKMENIIMTIQNEIQDFRPGVDNKIGDDEAHSLMARGGRILWETISALKEPSNQYIRDLRKLEGENQLQNDRMKALELRFYNLSIQNLITTFFESTDQYGDLTRQFDRNDPNDQYYNYFIGMIPGDPNEKHLIPPPEVREIYNLIEKELNEDLKRYEEIVRKWEIDHTEDETIAMLEDGLGIPVTNLPITQTNKKKKANTPNSPGKPKPINGSKQRYDTIVRNRATYLSSISTSGTGANATEAYEHNLYSPFRIYFSIITEAQAQSFYETVNELVKLYTIIKDKQDRINAGEDLKAELIQLEDSQQLYLQTLAVLRGKLEEKYKKTPGVLQNAITDQTTSSSNQQDHIVTDQADPDKLNDPYAD